MNESPLDSQNVPQSQQPGSSRQEADRLAEELANSYADYFRIDISDVKQKSEESVEECLAHLEEVCSVLDNNKQNDHLIGEFLKELSSKNESLKALYDQIDDLEQYISEKNRSLDELEDVLKGLEDVKKPGNRIKRVIELLPSMSLGNILPWNK